MFPLNTPHTHTRNSTVPAPKPWTSSTHALWPLPAQHIVHMAVVVLWKTYIINPQMYLPYELVEIILQSVVAPPKPLMSHNHADSDDESESGSEYTDNSDSDNQEDDDQRTGDEQDQGPDSDRGDDGDDGQDETDNHDSSEVEGDD
jgi:hypothetical protein